MSKKTTPAQAAIAAKPMMASDGDGDEYQTRQDARTLIDASKIKGDKKRHTKAKAHIQKHLAAAKAAVAEKSMPTGMDMGNGPDGGNLGV